MFFPVNGNKFGFQVVYLQKARIRIMENTYSYCCSKDGHGLRYPGLSVVMLQIFALGSIKEFKLPADLVSKGFITPNDNGIDRLIFTMGKAEKNNIKRFTLGGFDFTLPVSEPYPVTLSGSVSVQMSLFFGHTVSISYDFLFDGVHCKASETVATDHIIALLSTHLSAEHWSRNKENDSQTDINMEVEDFVISNLHLDHHGCYTEDGLPDMIASGSGRVFDRISRRYKKFIKRCCTVDKEKITAEERRLYGRYSDNSDGSYDDFHYAMVDIWENVAHPEDDGGNLFATDRTPKLSEADIVNHIRDWHKPELIGLMTLYPGEWPYRDPDAYDEVCGDNIAIDTDDLVLVNNNICVVIGTYGRRGADSPVDWEEHLKERVKYHVSWPEYLLILEMVLAKKYVIDYAKDQLIDASLGVEDFSSNDLLAHNAAISMRLSRMELQLDVVKYSKFMSHKVMFDRTTKRLGLDDDTEHLHTMMEVLDSSFNNLSDYEASKSDSVLNGVLVLISVASLFQLFFQNSEMPFLTHFHFENTAFTAWFVLVVALTTVIVMIIVGWVYGLKGFKKIKKVRARHTYYSSRGSKNKA